MPISWSINGFIAYSAPDSMAHNGSKRQKTSSPTPILQITHLENTASGFRLLEPIKLLESIKLLRKPPSVLSWSEGGDYLAAGTEVGELSIFASGLSETSKKPLLYSYAPLSEFSVLYEDPPSKKPSPLVCASWLPGRRGAPAYGMEPAKIVQNSVSYRVRELPVLVPQHPNKAKQAVLGVTASGDVCLWFQGAHGLNFSKTSVETGSCYSHACFSFRRSAAYLFGYNPVAGMLEAHEVRIEWNDLFSGKNGLFVSRLCRTPVPLVSSLTSANATHTPDSETDTYVATEKGPVLRYRLDLQGSQNVFSNGKPVKSSPRLVLQERHEFACGVVRALGTALRGGHVWFSGENGVISCVRAAFGSEGSQNGAKSEKSYLLLQDAGMVVKASSGEVCPLPSLLAAVSLAPNAHSLELSIGTLNQQGDSKHIPDYGLKELSAAFAVVHSESYFAKLCCDDAVAALIQATCLLQSENRASLIRLILAQCAIALRFLWEPTPAQLDTLFSNPMLQKLALLQMSLGTGSGWQRSKAARIAWTLINLRTCGFALTVAVKLWYSKDSNKQPLDYDWRAGTLSEATGQAKWLTDYVVYISQEILALSAAVTDPASFQKMFESLVAIPLLMSKVARMMLANALKLVRQLNVSAARLAATNQVNTSSKLAFVHAADRMKEVYEDPLADCTQFEKFLEKVDTLLGKSDQGTQTILVCEGSVPQNIRASVKSVLQAYMEIARPEMRLRITFADVEWLGLGVQFEGIRGLYGAIAGEPTFIYSKGEKIDYLRKKVIGVGRVKRCVRCGVVAGVENVTEIMKGGGKVKVGLLWDMMFQKSCICGGCWVI